MSRISLRGILKESKEKNFHADNRMTQPNTSKETSNQNSSILQSKSSSSNLSLTFTKEIKYPRLFADTPQNPMLFSFNPQSTKNSQSKTKINRSSGLCSQGSRTPSASNNYTSFRHFFEQPKQNKSLFAKKKQSYKESITIDLATKQEKKKPKHLSHSSSVSKDLRISDVHSKGSTMELNSSYNNEPKEENIKVYIRVKPKHENSPHFENYLQRIDERHIRISQKIKAYDHIFPVDSQQNQIFETVGKPIIEKVLEGFNGTVFAYGQTGSGKTYTIFGEDGRQGLIPLSVRYIFSKRKPSTQINYSLLEIYKEDLIDLLGNGKSDLKLKQTGNGMCVDGLTKHSLDDLDDFMNIIEEASKNRRVTCTKINEKSSRSHTILTINIINDNIESKLCLIDLAGSEKINKSGVTGQALEETKKINYSLSCLGNVINALITRKKNDHIPFRDSKLTRLLKDSLSGRFKTSLIVNCSSEEGTEEESLSSLKFADRAKKVKITISKATCKSKENIEYLHLVIRKLTTDLEDTKKQLNKYKQICQDKPQIEETDLTGRQTIPSERGNINERMIKYGKQNVMMNRKDKPILDLHEISSLNVSKSITNIFGEMSGPSVSSLSHRCDENSEDLSLNFSLHREESHRSRAQ